MQHAPPLTPNPPPQITQGSGRASARRETLRRAMQTATAKMTTGTRTRRNEVEVVHCITPLRSSTLQQTVRPDEE
eukprot:scaffold9053_cov86-Isochrysis_galbana.AAC.3